MTARVARRTYAADVHVVVVDDERRMVELVSGYLEELGFRTTGCHDGQEALVAARARDVDAVVLDLMLPGVSGLDVCRRLRREGNDVPILMLTARGAVPERVAGLEAGADDYLVKPFALEELAARLKAIRRRRENVDHRLVAGDVVLDPLEQRVWVADVEVTLARREFAMLNALMENAGRVVSRSRLFDEVWEGEVDLRSNSIDVHISRLRARLEGSSHRCEVVDAARRRLPPGDPPGEALAAAGRRPADRHPAGRRRRRRDDRRAGAGRGVRLLAGVLRARPPARPGPRRLPAGGRARGPHRPGAARATPPARPSRCTTGGVGSSPATGTIPPLLDAEDLADARAGREPLRRGPVPAAVGPRLPRGGAPGVARRRATGWWRPRSAATSTTRRCASCCSSSRSPTW